jgi:hypothetical protein
MAAGDWKRRLPPGRFNQPWSGAANRRPDAPRTFDPVRSCLGARSHVGYRSYPRPWAYAYRHPADHAAIDKSVQERHPAAAPPRKPKPPAQGFRHGQSLLLCAPPPTPLRASQNLNSAHRTVSCTGASHIACTGANKTAIILRPARQPLSDGYQKPPKLC